VTDLVTLHRLWFNWDVDLCLVPTDVAAELALQYKLDPEAVHVTGLPVNPALATPPESKKALRARLGWDTSLFTVLAVSSKRVEGMEDFLHVLNHAGFPIQLIVVAGGDDGLYARLQEAEWHIPVHPYNFVTEMPNFLHAADCVLSKAGGLIVTESLACGLPMLLIQAIAGQETGNAQYVVEGGAGDVTGHPLQLLETLCHWLYDGGRLFQERAANARRLGCPDAAYRAAELIWQLAGRGPVELRLRLPFETEQLKSLLQEFSLNFAKLATTTAQSGSE
jgi:1,2-diacylglycerol 3-beta-galactosyltransferase